MNGRKDNSAYGSYVPYSDQDINVPGKEYLFGMRLTLKRKI